MNKKIIKSRKLDNSENNARKSIISKVNEDANTSMDKKTSEEEVNIKNNEDKQNLKIKEIEDTNKDNDNDKKSKKDKKDKTPKKKGFKNFFMRLSIIGRISLVIYAILIIFFGYLIIDAISNNGKIIYGNRQEPVKVISKDQVSDVKEALEKDIDAKKIDVSYLGYRFVVVIDLGENAKLDDAEKINDKAWDIVNNVLPISEYFSSKDQLNNDIFIYSTNLVPTDKDQKSNFILQTYKNSKMDKRVTYDLTQDRDGDSRDEVIESIKKAQESAGN